MIAFLTPAVVYGHESVTHSHAGGEGDHSGMDSDHEEVDPYPIGEVPADDWSEWNGRMDCKFQPIIQSGFRTSTGASWNKGGACVSVKPDNPSKWEYESHSHTPDPHTHDEPTQPVQNIPANTGANTGANTVVGTGTGGASSTEDDSTDIQDDPSGNTDLPTTAPQDLPPRLEPVVEDVLQEPIKLTITHIENYKDNPFKWIVYILNEERRFVSTGYKTIEIWSKEELEANGKPKFYASLPRYASFTYQFPGKKHAYFTNPSGVRANNAFVIASKNDVKNWDPSYRPIKFAITRPHKHRRVYQEGDIFVLRDWKTKEIISQFPQSEEQEDAVPAAPMKPGMKLVTTWGKLKSLN